MVAIKSFPMDPLKEYSKAGFLESFSDNKDAIFISSIVAGGLLQAITADKLSKIILFGAGVLYVKIFFRTSMRKKEKEDDVGVTTFCKNILTNSLLPSPLARMSDEEAAEIKGFLDQVKGIELGALTKCHETLFQNPNNSLPEAIDDKDQAQIKQFLENVESAEGQALKEGYQTMTKAICPETLKDKSVEEKQKVLDDSIQDAHEMKLEEKQEKGKEEVEWRLEDCLDECHKKEIQKFLNEEVQGRDLEALKKCHKEMIKTLLPSSKIPSFLPQANIEDENVKQIRKQLLEEVEGKKSVALEESHKAIVEGMPIKNFLRGVKSGDNEVLEKCYKIMVETILRSPTTINSWNLPIVLFSRVQTFRRLQARFRSLSEAEQNHFSLYDNAQKEGRIIGHSLLQKSWYWLFPPKQPLWTEANCLAGEMLTQRPPLRFWNDFKKASEELAGENHINLDDDGETMDINFKKASDQLSHENHYDEKNPIPAGEKTKGES